MALFFVLFLVVRGTPAMLLYRRVLSATERRALAFFCATELPLVVAITTIAVDAGKMRVSTSAGLVGAAMLSTLIFPFVGIALQKRAMAERGDEPPPGGVAEAPAPA
jgi:Kef-type K+ transport system membrane component KefB